MLIRVNRCTTSGRSRISSPEYGGGDGRTLSRHTAPAVSMQRAERITSVAVGLVGMTVPVIDFLPPGVPPLLTPGIEAAVKRVEKRGMGAAGWEAMLDAQVEALRGEAEYRERVRGVYREAGVDVVCPTVWGGDPRLSFREAVHRDLARWRARTDAVEWLRPVVEPADARPVPEDGVGVLLVTQNLGAFTAGEVDRVDELYNAGVRVMQLTYNRQNHVGAGCNEPPGNGLSGHGRAVVERLNDLGVLIDLSHCNRATTLETVAASDRPVAYTHTHCGAFHDHPRAKSDEELEALAAADGYMGVLVYPHHYAEPSFETFFRHFEHALGILGEDRVGVVTDWCITTPDVPRVVRPALVEYFRRATTEAGRGAGMGFTPAQFDQGFERITEYGDRGILPGVFEEHGYTHQEVDGFLGGNFLAAWERAGA